MKRVAHSTEVIEGVEDYFLRGFEYPRGTSAAYLAEEMGNASGYFADQKG
jgi:hypothetical protein